MIKVECFCCLQELDKQGAILLSPPNKYSEVDKYHLCWACYRKVMEGISDIKHNIKKGGNHA